MKLFAIVTLMADGSKHIDSVWTTKYAALNHCDLEWGDSVLEIEVNKVNGLLIS